MIEATRYGWIGYTAARSSLAYAGEFLARVIFLTSILYIFMRLWLAVYRGAEADRVAGLTLQQMLWYLAVTEAITLSAPRVWSEVDQDVRTGRLAVRLIHPVSYMLSHLSRAMGERLVRFGMNLLIASVVAFSLVGPLPITPEGFAMFIVVLPLAFVLDFLGHFLVGLCAFWIESTAGLALIYTRCVMLAGGTLLPIVVYPEPVQAVLRWLPFASMIYAPGRMFVDPSLSLAKDVIVTQGLALAVLAALTVAVQSAALKRLFTNGG